METACQMINKQHKLLVDVLEGRSMKLNAALTFWDKKDLTQLTTYLVKADDDAVLVDVLPFMTISIKNEDEIGKLVTLGICLDLLPKLEKLLHSKYEDYITTSLDFLRIVTQHWFVELRKMKEDNDKSNKSVSLSIPPFYLNLINMQERLKKIARRSSSVGEKAKVVENILEQLT